MLESKLCKIDVARRTLSVRWIEANEDEAMNEYSEMATDCAQAMLNYLKTKALWSFKRTLISKSLYWLSWISSLIITFTFFTLTNLVCSHTFLRQPLVHLARVFCSP